MSELSVRNCVFCGTGAPAKNEDGSYSCKQLGCISDGVPFTASWTEPAAPPA